MEKALEKLLSRGCTASEILEAAKQLRRDTQLRCDSCNKRLGDISQGEIQIKCKCGKIVNYII